MVPLVCGYPVQSANYYSWIDMTKLGLHAMAIALALVLAACGNSGKSSNPPAGGITVVPRDSSVIVSWVPDSGADYWLIYAASAALTSTNASTLPGGTILQHVNSPVTVSALTNGTTYYFTIDARINGGPGGSGAPVVSATPRLAGSTWSAGTVA